ncbi:mitochondrial ribosomal small subunit component [Phlyctochytrium bullatum]|nr:mitochondrial ribosomal small subunit component [Phlyctochytrium bullatum]
MGVATEVLLACMHDDELQWPTSLEPALSVRGEAEEKPKATIPTSPMDNSEMGKQSKKEELSEDELLRQEDTMEKSSSQGVEEEYSVLPTPPHLPNDAVLVLESPVTTSSDMDIETNEVIFTISEPSADRSQINFPPQATTYDHYHRGLPRTVSAPERKKSFIPDVQKPIIIEISDDEIELRKPVKSIKDVKSLEEEIRKLARMIELKEKQGRANGKKPKKSLIGKSVNEIEGKEKTTSGEAVKPVLNGGAENIKPPQPQVRNVSGSKLQNTLGIPQAKFPQNTQQSSALLGLKKKLLEGIADDEKLLKSALSDILSKEESIGEITAKIELERSAVIRTEGELESLEKELSALMEKIESKKRELSASKDAVTDSTRSLNALKKLVLAKGNMASELRKGINEKQKQLLEVSKTAAKPKPKSQLSLKGSPSLKRKRVLLASANMQTSKPTEKTATTPKARPAAGDFIQFEDESVDNVEKVVNHEAHLSVEAGDFEILRKSLYDILPSGSRGALIVDNLVVFDDELCSVYDLARMDIHMESKISAKAKDAGIKLVQHDISTSIKSFVPYKTTTKKLKGYSGPHMRDTRHTGAAAKSVTEEAGQQYKKYQAFEALKSLKLDVFKYAAFRDLLYLNAPILTDELNDLLLGSWGDSKNDRYHANGLSNDEFESVLEEHPNRVEKCDYDDLALTWLFVFLTSSDIDTIFEVNDSVPIEDFQISVDELSDSFAFGVLDPHDYALGWTVFCYLIAFRQMPSGIFCAYPYDFIATSLFPVLDWSGAGKDAEDLDAALGMMSDYAGFLVSIMTEEWKTPFVMVLRNILHIEKVNNGGDHTVRRLLNEFTETCSDDISRELGFIALLSSSQSEYKSLEDARDGLEQVREALRWILLLEDSLQLKGYEWFLDGLSREERKAKRESFVVWHCLVLVEFWLYSVSDASIDVRKTLRIAIESCPTWCLRRHFWMELMRLEKISSQRAGVLTEKGVILDILEKALENVDAPPAFVTKCDEMIRPRNKRSFRSTNPELMKGIVVTALQCVPKAIRPEVFEVIFHSRRKSCILSTEFVQFLLDLRMWSHLKDFLIKCISNDPKSEIFWRLYGLLTLEATALGSKENVQRIMKKWVSEGMSSALKPESAMPRSVWKGPLLATLKATKPGEPIKTMERAATIIPAFVGKKFLIHNGKDYIPVLITEQMVNHKLGEFAPTRKPFTFKKSDKKGR